MANTSIATKAWPTARLLLDIYGALMILLIAGGRLILGLNPIEERLRLGAQGFSVT